MHACTTDEHGLRSTGAARKSGLWCLRTGTASARKVARRECGVKGDERYLPETRVGVAPPGVHVDAQAAAEQHWVLYRPKNQRYGLHAGPRLRVGAATNAAAASHGRGWTGCRAEGCVHARLGDDGELAAPRVAAYLGAVQAVQQHAPGGDVDEAEQREHQRGLAAARAPHHAAAGARLSMCFSLFPPWHDPHSHAPSM